MNKGFSDILALFHVMKNIYIFSLLYFLLVMQSDDDKNDQWLGVSVSSQGTRDGSAAVSLTFFHRISIFHWVRKQLSNANSLVGSFYRANVFSKKYACWKVYISIWMSMIFITMSFMVHYLLSTHHFKIFSSVTSRNAFFSDIFENLFVVQC